MRRLIKGQEPSILAENGAAWLRDWLADKSNDTKRYRYRHEDIKKALISETNNKCVYCESTLGVTHPGDTEHKIPSSKDDSRHFDWTNLTRACSECNRRKNAFYDANDGFIDPYADDVEHLFEHIGPIMWGVKGNAKAEVALRTLGLNAREALLLAKRDALMSLRDALLRYESEQDQTLKEVMRLDLIDRAKPDHEYSAMTYEVLQSRHVL